MVQVRLDGVTVDFAQGVHGQFAVPTGGQFRVPGDRYLAASGDFFMAMDTQGRLTAIMGPSGSGKSTLMHCLAGLDAPTSGSVVVDGVEISGLSQRRLTQLRRTRIGFVFQAYNLVPTLTAAENITLPLDIARQPVDRVWFAEVVDAVGMRPRLNHRPAELSGGEQQRVACARALAGRPSVVFADEPTGNLDSRSSRVVLEFLRRSVDELGQTVVMVTHDPRAASYAHRVLLLGDGRITADLDSPSREQILAAVGAEDDEGEERRPPTGRYAAVPAPRQRAESDAAPGTGYTPRRLR